ncbi:MAG: BRO family protein [Gammaproteobacteria bacterium WSBS_2016_MAG_OTU1]
MPDGKNVTVQQEVAGEFESISISNGNTHWKSSALMEWLGYTSVDSFDQAINRAMTVCNTLKIPMYDHFEEVKASNREFKLTRFACYLITMNGDPKKPQVAKAQVYFAQMAEIISHAMEYAESVERVHVRQEISEHTKSLGAIAQSREITSYAKFQSAGYMGLYNMSIGELRQIKGLAPDSTQSPMDFMAKRELAANLFRIAETEGRIKSNPKIRGQVALEDTAHKVGQGVRELMNVKPEVLAREITIRAGLS